MSMSLARPTRQGAKPVMAVWPGFPLLSYLGAKLEDYGHTARSTVISLGLHHQLSVG